MVPEPPPFTISTRFITLYGEIIREVIQLEGKIGFVNPRLCHANRIRSIHSSLAIENNTLTLEQVTDVINGKRVLGPASEIQGVKNANECYGKLPELDPFKLDNLLSTHGMMMKGICDEYGCLRSSGVGVFSGKQLIHLAPPPDRVYSLITNLLEWAKTTDVPAPIVSCVFHYELEIIHPFLDGNGRMGRLWQTLILSKWNPIFEWIPVESLVYDYRSEYYAAIQASTDGCDSSPFIELMLDLILRAIKEVHDTPRDISFTKTEAAILEIIKYDERATIDSLSSAIGVKNRTIERSLTSLQNKGVLIREGSKKSGRWVVLSVVDEM